MTYIFEASGHKCIVDDEDAHWVQRYAPRLIRVRAKYSKSPGHVAVNIKRKTVYLHRLIAGTPHGMQTDHIDGDTLNNRRSNLRIATRSQNAMNRGPNGNNPHGLKGVKLDKRAKTPTWEAKIKKDGKSYHLGSFRTPEDAHAAYCLAAAKIHGEFARTS